MSHLRPLRFQAAQAITLTSQDDPHPLRLGFLTPHDPFDATSFSGTASQAFAALQRHVGIKARLIGPHRPRAAASRFFRRRNAKPAPETFDLSPRALDGLDVIVGLVASDLLDRLPQTAPPYLHVTDATPACLVEEYGYDLSPEVFAREGRVADRAAACVFSSAMMARRAMQDSGICGAMPEVLPFGLNLMPQERLSKTPPSGWIELLFVGLDWDRKGGDIAVGALRHLRARGVDARLSIVGASPRHLTAEPGVKIVGFLDKNRPRDVAKLSELYARAHLLVLPTRGDCTPMVIGEAMAHGTPVLATDIGGIAEMAGVPGAGRILPLDAQAPDWAAEIAAMTTDAESWSLLSDAARDRAKGHFSWDAWARGIAGIARGAVLPSERRRYGT